jgi:hypothetical protein
MEASTLRLLWLAGFVVLSLAIVGMGFVVERVTRRGRPIGTLARRRGDHGRPAQDRCDEGDRLRARHDARGGVAA